MPPHTDDLRIRSFAPLSTPAELQRELPCTEPMSDNVANARRALHRILHGEDDRLAVVIGPCSIHDPRAAMEYAQRLRPLRDSHGDALEIVMRVYFEKPRTTVGWKGLINDPDLDGSFNINKGLRLGRRLLVRHQCHGLAGRRRVSRHDLAAVHLRSRCMGRDRRAHDREPSAPRAGVGPLVPRRVQERHRRERQDCRRRCRRGVTSASFSGRDQGWSGHRRDDGRQSRMGT